MKFSLTNTMHKKNKGIIICSYFKNGFKLNRPRNNDAQYIKVQTAIYGNSSPYNVAKNELHPDIPICIKKCNGASSSTYNIF